MLRVGKVPNAANVDKQDNFDLSPFTTLFRLVELAAGKRYDSDRSLGST